MDPDPTLEANTNFLMRQITDKKSSHSPIRYTGDISDKKSRTLC
jgi:hypothetical protein